MEWPRNKETPMAKMHGWLLGQDATCQNAGDPLQICRAIFCTRADTPRARPDRNGGRRIRHAAGVRPAAMRACGIAGNHIAHVLDFIAFFLASTAQAA